MGDVLARQKIVFRIKLEAPQIDCHPDVQGGAGAPTQQDDEGKKQEVPDEPRLIIGQRRNVDGRGQQPDDDCQPQRPAVARDQGPPEKIPLRHKPGQQAEDKAMDEVTDDDRRNENDHAQQPVRCQADQGFNDVFKSLFHAPDLGCSAALKRSIA